MACQPFVPPQPGLFINVTQGVWSNANQSPAAGKSATYSGGTLTVVGPNGSLSIPPAGTQVVRHKFFGPTNFLAVLVSESGPGPRQHWMSIIDFTAPSIQQRSVLNVLSDSAGSPPWLQHANGSGSACLVGAPTGFGVAGLAILRSDTGVTICPGPPPFNPTQQIIGEATATALQIKHGNTIIGGPCNFPSGRLDVIPNSQSFPTVTVGGCASSPSTRQFTLKNSGDDCLAINGVTPAAPYSVTGQSTPFPADLNPGQTMTVTVTFAPTAAGSFNNVSLAVSRTPAVGDSSLICSGQAQQAQPALSATPALANFGSVPVGSSAAATVTVKNTGGVPLTVQAAGSSGVFSWNPLGPTTLSCGQQTTISVTFTPTAEGPQSATLTVTSPSTSDKVVQLSGSGCVPDAKIQAPPAPFPAYGQVRQNYRMPRFATVRNTGDDTLTFTATISGPDAALFGLMKPSQSITDVVATRTYIVQPVARCGPGPTGDGAEEVAVVFFANAAPPYTATATLTIDNHNDPSAAASFTYALTGEVIAANVVDVVGVFDTSGSMGGAVAGGGTKMAAAIQAGKLLVELLPPDLNNRVAATRFSTDASTFLPIDFLTTGNQPAKRDAIADPPLSPAGWTAIAAGAMTGVVEFANPRPGGPPPNLTKAMIVLTDGIDNTAYKNPADNQYYSILGGPARDPANLSNTVNTLPFVPPSDVEIYAVGLGTGQDISIQQLAALSGSAGGYYGSVDPTRPAAAYELMKFYTQIFMDLVDTSTIVDPKNVINAGDKHIIEFDVLRGDVNGMVVMYDFDGERLPFYLETPNGEMIDAAFVPAGFQLRSGWTDQTRFLDFQLPVEDPGRFAGRWKLVVLHRGRVCYGRPVDDKDDGDRELGFLPRECRETKAPVEYGYAIGVGSNFRLQAYVTPGSVKVGDPIRLTGVPTEAGLAVTGCTVTVDVTAPNGQALPGLVLRDDGVHQDGDPDDGEYAWVFPTNMAGSYTFRFRATGQTRDGELVNREATRSKYVEGYVTDPPHGDPGGRDDCCERLVTQLERQYKLLQRALKQSPKSAG